jgi:DnaA family protein
MNQLLFDFLPQPKPTFENFVAGPNAEAIAAVRRAAGDAEAPLADRFVYLWGQDGSGRSHLLKAACDAYAGRLVDGATATAATLQDALDSGSTLLAVDDVDRLDGATQEALFHAINALRERPRATLLASGPLSPRDLKLDAGRDDLRSRLAWGLVYRLEGLDDAETSAALERHARHRGFPLPADAREYLLTRCPRDLASLMELLDRLDEHARQTRRAMSAKLVHEYLDGPRKNKQKAA